MGCDELIESLLKTGDERAGSLWEEAKAEAARLREEASVRIGQRRAELDALLVSEVREKTGRILADGENRARKVRFTEEAELSDRLYEIAQSCLGELRREDYPAVFDGLASELPALSWQFVRVNPEDVRIARERFPDAEIVPDNEISGGVDATAVKGKMRVINTFEKRLERAWPDMVPGLISAVYSSMSEHGSAHQS